MEKSLIYPGSPALDVVFRFAPHLLQSRVNVDIEYHWRFFWNVRVFNTSWHFKRKSRNYDTKQNLNEFKNVWEKDINMVHPCHVNTANLPPVLKVYSLFFDNSVPNISAKPVFNFAKKNMNNMILGIFKFRFNIVRCSLFKWAQKRLRKFRDWIGLTWMVHLADVSIRSSLIASRTNSCCKNFFL